MTYLDDSSQVFNRLRPRLQDIAYHMLGSTIEAEDVVQDAWLRWREAAHHVLDNAEPWLISVTTRLATGRLQAMSARGDNPADPRLPELLFGDLPASRDQVLEIVENIWILFLKWLERMTPHARAAFVMREVFGVDLREIAATLGNSEPDCRELVHHAKFQLMEKHSGFIAKRKADLRLLRHFAAASERGDLALLKVMLAEDAELITYGTGGEQNFGKPLRGGRRIARLYFAIQKRYGGLMRTQLAPVDGDWILLRFINGTLESTQLLETQGARIVRIHTQCNPENLADLSLALRSP